MRERGREREFNGFRKDLWQPRMQYCVRQYAAASQPTNRDMMNTRERSKHVPIHDLRTEMNLEESH